MEDKEKTIGIITMHRVVNYGSVLQAHALYHAISGEGYKTEIIDYCFPNQKSLHLSKVEYMKRRLRHFVATLLRPKQRIREKRIRDFFFRTTKTGKCYRNAEQLKLDPPLYDCYVTGSDQVWSCRHTRDDLSFLLPFVPEDKVRFSYASSFGYGSVSPDLAPCYARLLEKYSSISVRERSGIKQISSLGIKKNVQVVLDPVFLPGRTYWMEKARHDRFAVPNDYLLLYILTYSFNPYPAINKIVEHVVQTNKLNLVIIGKKPSAQLYRNATAIEDAGPEEFLDLILNAKGVLTTSFHGTAFSLIFQKPFIAITNNEFVKDDRIAELLKGIGAEDSVFEISRNPQEASLCTPNEDVLKKIESLRNESKDYLRNALRFASFKNTTDDTPGFPNGVTSN